MSRTQHIFVDYENIHEVDLDLVAGKEVIVHLVLGERNNNLPLEMVKRLVKYKEQVHLVEAGKSGKNALDFVLAYRVGVESAAYPEGYYHIVSKDTGFDALILHLRKHNILARRDESFAKAFDDTTKAPLSRPFRPGESRHRETHEKQNQPAEAKENPGLSDQRLLRQKTH